MPPGGARGWGEAAAAVQAEHDRQQTAVRQPRRPPRRRPRSSWRCAAGRQQGPGQQRTAGGRWKHDQRTSGNSAACWMRSSARQQPCGAHTGPCHSVAAAARARAQPAGSPTRGDREAAQRTAGCAAAGLQQQLARSSKHGRAAIAVQSSQCSCTHSTSERTPCCSFSSSHHARQHCPQQQGHTRAAAAHGRATQPGSAGHQQWWRGQWQQECQQACWRVRQAVAQQHEA
jgi:hypothetical protein